jgi:hypothetical protein
LTFGTDGFGPGWVTGWTGDFDAVVFFGEGGDVRGALVFVFLEVEFAEVGMEGEVFDFTVF